MSDSVAMAGLLLLAGAAMLAALVANRITQRVRLPAPLLVLAAAAVAAQVFPGLVPGSAAVEHLVTVALILILFDGGIGIGWPAFRASARTISLVGVAGTFLTTLGVTLVAHLVLGLGWYAAVLVATAVSPTDPAMVFSVLGDREVSGRSGTVLEGESGANDPVGIALMAGLLGAGALSAGAWLQVGVGFVLQMAVGAVVGVAGGRALVWFMRRVPLPGGGLYPVRTLACALVVYGAAAIAGGSGFLAVFVAGVLIGEARAPYKREIEHFHAALASLGEIAAFVVLGLTVDLASLARASVWVPGLVLAVVLALVVRPLALEPLLLGSGLARRERSFVMFAGLKGAVPILLGTFIVAEGVGDSERLYGIVVVVVVFSVLVQGTLLPGVARLLRIPMRSVDPEPWALGVRLREEPQGVQLLTVASGAAADGARIGDLPMLPEGAWISLVVRAGGLVPITGDTVLESGDQALVIAEPQHSRRVAGVFERPAAT